MNPNKLIATGLSPLQASAYALLIESGDITPTEAAKKLQITRTNSYKLLDKLASIGLAIKKETGKKIVYGPNNPQALSNLVTQQRNIAASREYAVQNVLSELLSKYHAHTEQPFTTVVTGKLEVVEAYRAQIRLGQDIYFIRSDMDITALGFDTMHEIRVAPARHGAQRYGITPDIATGTTANPEGDVRSNLTRTWARQEDYNAPVEWSISGSSLLIVVFGDQPHAVTIENPVIAEAFKQIWHMLNTLLQTMPDYKDLPRS